MLLCYDVRLENDPREIPYEDFKPSHGHTAVRRFCIVGYSTVFYGSVKFPGHDGHKL